MPSYDLDTDISEWIDECGGAEAAERFLNELAERFPKPVRPTKPTITESSPKRCAGS
jgi:hypothetical protein